MNWKYLSVILILWICAPDVYSVSFEEDTRLTAQQGEILMKFRQRVQPILPKKYMSESIFLVRWLRARNFDIDRATEMLKQHLEWRRVNKMDRIDEENWRDFESEYPWVISGFDKDGRPIIEMLVREWDLRKAMVTGRREQLIRWSYKMFEDGTKLVRKLQEEGKNVTQCVFIIDAEGFNPVTHGCPSCMPYFFAIATVYEEHFPGSMDKIHVVNTPEFFRVILRLMWPILSDNTKQALKVHGTDRNEWRKILAQDIDKTQLQQNFGGVKDI